MESMTGWTDKELAEYDDILRICANGDTVPYTVLANASKRVLQAFIEFAENTGEEEHD